MRGNRWYAAVLGAAVLVACNPEPAAGPTEPGSPLFKPGDKPSQSGTTLGAYKSMEACYEGDDPFAVKFFGAIVINRLGAEGTENLTVDDFIQNLSAGGTKVAGGFASAGTPPSVLQSAGFSNISIAKFPGGGVITEIAACSGSECDPNEQFYYETTGDAISVLAGQVYRNTASITITNHSGWLAGGKNCPAGSPLIVGSGCPKGPETKFTLTVPTGGFPACGAEGCTLTQGYWKNHAESWPTGYNADDAFFGSGQTWLAILNTPPAGGNAYLQLAHQYIAATLNVANGASSSAIDADLTAAAGFLTGHSIADGGGSDANAMKALATILDNYNNGDLGPGHCDDKEADPTP